MSASLLCGTSFWAGVSVVTALHLEEEALIALASRKELNMASLKERHHDGPPVIVHWPLLYANKEFVGQGTLLNVSHWGCQVAGTMPVASGMVLKLWISPPHRGDALYVKEARVLWARAHEFGIELREVDVQDHQWLMAFFKECGHTFRQVVPTQPE